MVNSYKHTIKLFLESKAFAPYLRVKLSRGEALDRKT